MTDIASVDDLLAVVETAEQRLEAGEGKARRAGDLLARAEELRKEAQAHQERVKEEEARIEAALERARGLRALVGEETVARAEELLEQTRSRGRAEVERLLSKARAAEAEGHKLGADPDVQAYLDHQDAQEQAEREARERAGRALRARLETLRPKASAGEGVEELEALAAEAEEAGFPEIAGEARGAVEAAHRQAHKAAEEARRRAQARAEAEARRRKRRFFRWAERRSRVAQPGDFVFVLGFAGETLGQAVHLRPLPARSGRLRFQVVETWSMNGQAPEEYADLSARGRTWEWHQPPAGEPEGLNQAQVELVRRLCRDRVPGWKVNRENARLAERLHRMTARQIAVTRKEGRGETAEEEGIHGAASPEAEARSARAGRDRESSRREERDQVLDAPSELVERREEDDETYTADVNAEIESEATTEAEGEAKPKAETDPETQVDVEGLEEPSVPSVLEPQARGLGPESQTLEVCPQGSGRDETIGQTPGPAITVVGDGLSGRQLAQWRGAARVGLRSLAVRPGIEEIQLLVGQEEGGITLMACWPRGEITLCYPTNGGGRSVQMKAIRDVAQQIRASA